MRASELPVWPKALVLVINLNDSNVPTVLVPNFKMNVSYLEVNSRNTILNTLNDDNVVLTISIA